MPSGREHETDREHLLFLAILLGFLTWYLWTAAAASFTFSNLILIAPVGAAAFILLLYIGAAEIFGHARSHSAALPEQTEPSPHGAGGRFRSASLGTVAALMGLFGLFVVAIPYVGFDVATFAFVAATMWLLGERRIVFLLGLSLGIAAALSIAALTLLTFPMPLTVARTLWSGWWLTFPMPLTVARTLWSGW